MTPTYVPGDVLLDVWVAHEPQQVGSKNAFPVYVNPREPNPWKRIPKRNPAGGIIITVTDENAKAKKFIRAAAKAARKVYREPAEADVPFELEVTFHVHRPLGHWGTGRNAHLLKDSAPARPTTMPDEDKLLRAAQDALHDIVWANDSQVVRAVAFKVYAGYSNEGVEQLGARFVVRRHAFVTAADLPLEERTRVPPPGAAEDDGEQTSLLVA